ncbi:MAG: hypothetical protein ACTHU0_24170 [Kofleriaceae bacterium]
MSDPTSELPDVFIDLAPDRRAGASDLGGKLGQGAGESSPAAQRQADDLAASADLAAATASARWVAILSAAVAVAVIAIVLASGERLARRRPAAPPSSPAAPPSSPTAPSSGTKRALPATITVEVATTASPRSATAAPDSAHGAALDLISLAFAALSACTDVAGLPRGVPR